MSLFLLRRDGCDGSDDKNDGSKNTVTIVTHRHKTPDIKIGFYENQGDFDNASPVFVKAPQRFCKPDLPEYETVLKPSIPINTERLPQKPQTASQSPRHFADERMKVS